MRTRFYSNTTGLQVAGFVRGLTIVLHYYPRYPHVTQLSDHVIPLSDHVILLSLQHEQMFGWRGTLKRFPTPSNLLLTVGVFVLLFPTAEEDVNHRALVINVSLEIRNKRDGGSL